VWERRQEYVSRALERQADDVAEYMTKAPRAAGTAEAGPHSGAKVTPPSEPSPATRPRGGMEASVAAAPSPTLARPPTGATPGAAIPGFALVAPLGGPVNPSPGPPAFNSPLGELGLAADAVPLGPGGDIQIDLGDSSIVDLGMAPATNPEGAAPPPAALAPPAAKQPFRLKPLSYERRPTPQPPPELMALARETAAEPSAAKPVDAKPAKAQASTDPRKKPSV
jgi:hypothetical protein